MTGALKISEVAFRDNVQVKSELKVGVLVGVHRLVGFISSESMELIGLMLLRVIGPVRLALFLSDVVRSWIDAICIFDDNHPVSYKACCEDKSTQQRRPTNKRYRKYDAATIERDCDATT